MRIAFTGSHGTGKTTLIEELKNLDRFKNYVFHQNLTRSLRDRVPINEQGTELTQVFVINKHMERLVDKNSILDRCLIDGYIYTSYLYKKGKISEWIYRYAHDLMYTFLDLYDVIFYICPEFNLPEDGVRSNSLSFRDDIVSLFEDIIGQLKHSKKVSIVKITGTVEERIQQVVRWVEKNEGINPK